jgi:hypothetical protein
MVTKRNHDDDVSLVRAAEDGAQSARAAAERRYTQQGAQAPAGTPNPYRAGCAAATWWQRGHDAAHTKN